jgi:hypothetical protein
MGRDAGFGTGVVVLHFVGGSTPRAHVMPEEQEECFKVRYAQLPITAAPAVWREHRTQPGHP